jgi:hypothetical protein
MRIYFLVLSVFLHCNPIAAGSWSPIMPGARSSTSDALPLIDNLVLPKTGTIWPHVDVSIFLKNLRENVINPEVIYQGKNTNFCGYAALTHLLVTHDPRAYTQCMLDLLTKGEGRMGTVVFRPSKTIRKKAGTLTHKGFLDNAHADQIWFLTLADEFKGYLNILNRRFQTGDENKPWASTNFAKFNRMARKLGGYNIDSRGGDIIKPHFADLPRYISMQLEYGNVVLFANRRIKDKKPPRTMLWLPTHFIVVNKVITDETFVVLHFWDYGSHKIKVMTREKFRKTVFGVSTFSYTGNEIQNSIAKSE